MSTIVNDLISYLQCGEIIAANDAVYISPSDGKIYKFDVTDSDLVFAGIAKESGILNAYIRVVQSGRVKGFTGLTPGVFIYASTTVPGGYQEAEPSASQKIVLGIAKSATEIVLNGGLGIKPGGAGSGSYNYIENGLADSGTDGWVLYANTTVGIRPDDFGGTPAGLTFSVDTINNLIGTNSFKLAKDAADRRGQGVYYQFSNEKGHSASTQLLSAIADLSHANFFDADMAVYLVASNDSFVADFQVIESANPDIKAGALEILKRFQFLSGDLSYRLCFHIKSTSALAYDIYLDDVSLAPKSAVTGAVMSDWKEDIPLTSGMGTVTFNQFISRRVGSNLEVLCRFSTGTPVASIASITLPDNLQVELSIGSKIGDCARQTTTPSQINVVATPSDPTKLFFGTNLSTGNGNALFGTSESVSFFASVPIQGWSSNAISSEDYGSRDIYVKAAGNSGAVITANTEAIDFTIVSDTSSSFSQVGIHGTDTFTALETGTFSLSGYVASTTTGNRNILLYKNGVYLEAIGNGSNGASSNLFPFSSILDLNKGDVLDIRIDGTVTLNNIVQSHHLAIKKLASSQSIWETETVAARYTSNSGQTIPHATETRVIFEDLVHDSHGIYDPLTGIGTVKVGGLYDIEGKVTISGLNSAAGQQHYCVIKVNGSPIEDERQEAQASNATMIFRYRASAKSIRLNRGDTFDFYVYQANGVSGSLNAIFYRNTFAITRVGD